MRPAARAAVEVVRATAADVDAVATSLGRAFEDDPVMAWLFPDPTSRLRGVTQFFTLALRDVHLPHGVVDTAGGMKAAAVWDAPGRWRMPITAIVRNSATLVRLLGTRTPRSLRGLSAIESRHPRWPHWYLAILGTDPDHQGQGLGAAVLGARLDQCDREGMGAYLESSKSQNVPYYERFGFGVVDEVGLPGGPPVWLMWRHAERSA